MSDIILFFVENQFVVMFFSAFLSATVLPGNSEVVLVSYASQLSFENQLDSVIALWVLASVGNSLGSLTTYGLARLFPKPKITENPNKVKRWAVFAVEKYGVWTMGFSWLPVVGDVLCGVAGWMRLPFLFTTLLIFFGKALRYTVILWGVFNVF